MKNDKQKVAFSSVIAAFFLTAMKIIVGIFTGSLGIISEALHSLLDLFAAIITYFAVKFSDKPADSEHHYGHGKIESFSALIETVLLLVTCVWIIYEAVGKLFFDKSMEVKGSQWGIIIMIISIIVDLGRVKVLKKVAKEHGSQALEADALHFSSDVWSSSVVIIGLFCVFLGKQFNIPLLNLADPIAALGVAVLVIKVSIKMGKETINVLLDTAPTGMQELVFNETRNINGVLEISDIKIRLSGAIVFININIGVDKNKNHNELHIIVNEIRQRIQNKIPKSDIFISTIPIELLINQDAEIYLAVKLIVEKFPICTNIHNIRVYEVNGKKKVAAHIELKENIELKESHDLAHKISSLLQEELAEIDNATIHFQCFEKSILAEDITLTSQDIVLNIINTIKKICNDFNCYDITLYRQNNKISAFLKCELNQNYSVDKLDLVSKNIIYELKNNIDSVDSIHIHFEPSEEI